MPRDRAERVVAGAKALSPNLGNRMLPVRLMDKAVVMRELMPQDIKLEIERLEHDDALALASYLAGVLGRAHGRQMDMASRKGWRRNLSDNSSKSLDVPSWLSLALYPRRVSLKSYCPGRSSTLMTPSFLSRNFLYISGASSSLAGCVTTKLGSIFPSMILLRSGLV